MPAEFWLGAFLGAIAVHAMRALFEYAKREFEQ